MMMNKAATMTANNSIAERENPMQVLARSVRENVLAWAEKPMECGKLEDWSAAFHLY